MPINLDVKLLQLAARLRSAELDQFVQIATDVGGPRVLSLITLLVALWMWLILPRSQSLPRLQFLGVAALGSITLVRVLKPLIARARPEVTVHLVNEPGFSFPSGHAVGTTVMMLSYAVVLGGLIRSSRGRSLLWVFSVLTIGFIAASRVYLGVHYPSDVVGGIALGAGWVWALNSATERRQKRRLGR